MLLIKFKEVKKLDLEQIGQNFYNQCVKLANVSQWIVLGVLVVVVVAIGISLMASKKARENAKEWIPWVLLGAVFALSPVAIAEAVSNMAKF